MDEREAERIKRRHLAELMQLEGVCGVSLRRDEKGDTVLVLFLEETADPARLPKTIDGLTVAHERAGPFTAQ